MKKFLCFSTLVMGGITLGISLNNAIWERWSDSDTLTVFAGLAVIFGGVMAGLHLPFKPDEKLVALAAEWERLHNQAAKQRDETMELVHRIEAHRDQVLADYERALGDWQKTTDALRQKVTAQ